MKILEKEIWKDIKGFEGIYQVSNLGRVRSLPRQTNNQFGKKEKILKPQLVRGYYIVCLHKNSIRKFYYVHRLVYEAFNGQIPKGLQVNHLDERPINNALSNLNLMTPKENTNYGTGIQRGHNKQINGKCSKPVLQFDLNDNLVKEYPSIKQAERDTGFANQHISACCKGKLKQAYGYIWKYKENKKGEN